MNRSTLNLPKGLTVILLALGSSVVAAQPPSPQLEKTQTLAKARDAYYNLRRQGLIEFRSNVEPNWDLLLEGVENKANAISRLNNLRFSLSIDPQSKLQLTTRVEEPLTDPKIAERLNMIVRGMDSAVKQFFATWSFYMLTSPFPAGNEYEVTEVAGQYRFSHKEGASEVVTITDKDFMVIEMRVSAPTQNAWLKPVFEKTSNGFILKSFEASNANQTQTGPRFTSLKTRIEYSAVSGLQLLQKVSVDTIQNGIPAQIEWLFTDYQVKVR